MNAQQIAEALMDRGISFEVCRNNGVTYYLPSDGFYKSDGMASLYDDPCGETVLTTRYNGRKVVTEPMDIVAESKDWHDYSEDRLAYWATPPSHWAALYAELPA